MTANEQSILDLVKILQEKLDELYRPSGDFEDELRKFSGFLIEKEWWKEVYSISELQKLGYPKEYLRTIVHRPGQRFAWKKNPENLKSPIMINRYRFDRFIEEECERSIRWPDRRIV